MNDNNILKLIENSDKLPIIPQQISEILDMLLNPTTFDMDELSQKISFYSNLQEMILKYLNLINFNFARKINSLREAIIYLGAQNVKNVLISFITKLLLPDRNSGTRIFSSSQYWKHCIGTSVASVIISERTGISDKYKIFSYGLIHDIGVTVLEICLPDLLDKIHELQLKGIHQLVAERMVLGGLTHSDIGVWLCKKWNLSSIFIDIVGFHHTPLLATANLDEVRVIHLGDTISTNYYERLLGLNSSYIYSEQVMKSVGITKDDMSIIIERLPNEVEKFVPLIDFFTSVTINRIN